MGLDFLSLDPSYAIVQNMDGSTFSFHRRVDTAPPDIRIQWFTNELDKVALALDERGAHYQIHDHSDIQLIISLTSPNGIRVEIWSGDEK